MRIQPPAALEEDEKEELGLSLIRLIFLQRSGWLNQSHSYFGANGRNT